VFDFPAEIMAFLFVLSEDDDIVNVTDAGFQPIRTQNCPYEVLPERGCVHESLGHAFEFEGAPGGVEGCQVAVVGVELHVIEGILDVNFREPIVLGHVFE
jgi:hypothetical protein